jgi:hypothetical protein
MRCAFATGLMAAAVVVTGCGSSELSASGPDEPAGTTRIIRQAMPAHDAPPKHWLRGCLGGTAVYCNPAPHGGQARGFIARFPDVGLGHGGRAIVRLWCDHGTPMPILEQPSGRRVRPDLEVITSIPDTPEGRKLAVPDVCG